MLAVFVCTAAIGADTNDVRHVEVQSLLGQVYDTAIAADDAETFGLSIPRGTALPRRLYPVRSLGVPMIHRMNQPLYKEVLLRRPQRSHTEYLDPNPESIQPATPPEQPPAISVTTTTGDVNALVLSWPATAGGWQLESASALTGDGSVWSPVPESSYYTNGATIFCLQPFQPVGASFFRIHKP